MPDQEQRASSARSGAPADREATRATAAQHAASKRPPLDHPVRKPLYALTGVRGRLNEAALDVEGLIRDLRAVDTDAATWDEIVQLRRDLRVAAMQLDVALQAAQNWSRKAAADA